MTRPRQVNFQVDEDLLEDLKVLARRRGQTMSELIRRVLEAELISESQRHVRISEEPTFTTPDVLPSGQTGWDIDMGDRINMRKHYRTCRNLGMTREAAQRSVCMWLSFHRPYVGV